MPDPLVFAADRLRNCTCSGNAQEAGNDDLDCNHRRGRRGRLLGEDETPAQGEIYPVEETQGSDAFAPRRSTPFSNYRPSTIGLPLPAF